MIFTKEIVADQNQEELKITLKASENQLGEVQVNQSADYLQKQELQLSCIQNIKADLHAFPYKIQQQSQLTL